MERRPGIYIYSGLSELDGLAKEAGADGFFEKGSFEDADRFEAMISKGTKVVIIDDDPGILQSKKFLVEILGGIFYGFHSGGDALKELPSINPDIVLVDYLIIDNEFSGKEIINKIRELFPNKPVGSIPLTE